MSQIPEFQQYVELCRSIINFTDGLPKGKLQQIHDALSEEKDELSNIDNWMMREIVKRKLNALDRKEGE